LKLPILFYVLVVSSFLAAILGLARYSSLDKGGKALVILCVVNYFEGTISFLLSLNKIRNLELLNNYRPVELVLTALVFYLMVNSRIVKRLVFICASAYVLVWIADKIYLDDPAQLNSRMAMLSRLIAIIMSISALYSEMVTSEGVFFKYPLFWVGASVLLYSSGTLLLLGWGNQLIGSGRETFVTAWQINWILLIVANLFYTKGLLCKPQRPM
jgi:hypothetical protein